MPEIIKDLTRPVHKTSRRGLTRETPPTWLHEQAKKAIEEALHPSEVQDLPNEGLWNRFRAKRPGKPDVDVSTTKDGRTGSIEIEGLDISDKNILRKKLKKHAPASVGELQDPNASSWTPFREGFRSYKKENPDVAVGELIFPKSFKPDELLWDDDF